MELTGLVLVRARIALKSFLNDLTEAKQVKTRVSVTVNVMNYFNKIIKLSILKYKSQVALLSWLGLATGLSKSNLGLS